MYAVTLPSPPPIPSLCSASIYSLPPPFSSTSTCPSVKKLPSHRTTSSVCCRSSTWSSTGKASMWCVCSQSRSRSTSAVPSTGCPRCWWTEDYLWWNPPAKKAKPNKWHAEWESVCLVLLYLWVSCSISCIHLTLLELPVCELVLISSIMWQHVLPMSHDCSCFVWIWFTPVLCGGHFTCNNLLMQVDLRVGQLFCWTKLNLLHMYILWHKQLNTVDIFSTGLYFILAYHYHCYATHRMCSEQLALLNMAASSPPGVTVIVCSVRPLADHL